jgi:hypothetical protein
MAQKAAISKLSLFQIAKLLCVSFNVCYIAFFNEEGVSTEEIIIITPKSERNSIWKSDTQLGNFILSWNMETEMELAIRVCTIFSFKGLESSVIILSELDKAPSEILKQLIYVGLSRARHHTLVLGALPTIG